MLKNKTKLKGGRALAFSLFLVSQIFYSQTFVRHSDEKVFDSVVVLQKGKKLILNKSNFNSFQSAVDDKVLFNSKLLDFHVSNDTLIFFDKVKEIEGLHLEKEIFDNKREKTFKSNKANATAQIYTNNLLATFISIKAKKKTFVKSIIFYPETSLFPNDISGSLKIQILHNLNGFPDNDTEILSFERDIAESVNKEWEIVLPRIIKYPESGFFVTFYYQSSDKKKTSVLKLNSDSQMYMFYPQDKQWKRINNNGYLYKLKVLQ